MNKLLIAILCITICALELHAGVKVFTFSGTLTRFDNEYHRIFVNNGKKEMSFFVLLDDFNNTDRIWDDCKDCSVMITYKKNRKLLIANKIDIQEHIALHHDQ